MSRFSDLADLLEKAAIALREADAALNGIPSADHRHLTHLKDYNLLSVRLCNILERAEIGTVAKLCSHSKDDILCLRNFGQTTFQELRRFMVANNLTFKGEEPHQTIPSPNPAPEVGG